MRNRHCIFLAGRDAIPESDVAFSVNGYLVTDFLAFGIEDLDTSANKILRPRGNVTKHLNSKRGAGTCGC